jgi:PAS domain S-box-containing protein
MKRTIAKKEKRKPGKTIRKKTALEKTTSGRTIKNKAKKKELKSEGLRVLILEDNPADAELMERQLRRDKITCQARRAETRRVFIKALTEFKPDLILADYTLPKFDAMTALKLSRKQLPFIPFIVVTGSIGEEKAVACLRAGANDYLLKDRLARLGEAVRHARESRRLQAEKTAAEVALRSSELLYRTFIDSSADMAFLKDEKFRHLLANRELRRFYGKAENEIFGRTDFELMGEKAAARCRQSDEQALAENRIHISEEMIGERTFETHKFPVKLGVGRVGVGGYIRDISERKRAREQIEQAARKWSVTFDAIRDGIALLATDQTVMQANRAFADLLDKPFKEIIGKKCYELVHPTRRPDPNCPFVKMLKSKKRESMEMAVGDRVFAVIVDPITDAARAITGATHILSDITERKRAEAALRESENKFRDLAELLPQTIFETDLQGRLTFVNRSAYEIFGYDENDFRIGLQIWQMIAPGDQERAKENVRRVLGGESIAGNEYACRRKDGSGFPVILFSTPILTAGKLSGLRGILVDISERKEIESQREAALAALRENEEFLNRIIEQSPMAMWISDNQGTLIRINRACCDLLQIREDEVIGKYNVLKDSIVEAQGLLPMVREVFEKGETVRFEIIYNTAQLQNLELNRKVSLILDTTVFPIKDIHGRVTHAVIQNLDISGRKRAEASLRESKERFKAQYQGSPIAAFTWQKQGEAFVLKEHNANAEKITHGRVTEFVGKSTKELYENRPDIMQAFHRCFDKKGVVSIETSSRHFIPGKLVSTTFAFVPPDLVMVHLEDVTERRQAEKALHESEQRYRSIMNEAGDAILMHDQNGRIIDVNRIVCQNLGYSREELLSMSIGDIDPEAIRSGKDKLWEAIFAGEHHHFESHHLRKNGSSIPVEVMLGAIRLPQGPMILGIVRDISERKQAEDKINRLHERMTLAADAAKIGIWDWDIINNTLVWDENMYAIYGRSKENFTCAYEAWLDAIHPEDKARSDIESEKARKGEKEYNTEFRIVIPDGEIKHIKAQGNVFRDEKGSACRMIGVNYDISALKKYEEKIKSSLREKEVLLKEIHHRVKNNLQVISGLLTLQAEQSNDERVQRLLKESQSRIWTMALIHQTLYQSGNLAAIDMAEYIRTLSGNLLSSQARVAMPPTVSFDLLPVQLAIDKAIPLALIINELLTNTLKHAFPDGRAGEIRISLQERRGVKFYAPTEDTGAIPGGGTSRRAPTHELTVADNGVGLPEGFDATNQKSLGLQLVTMLTKQLDGALAIESCGGTSVSIAFNGNEKSKKTS